MKTKYFNAFAIALFVLSLAACGPPSNAKTPLPQGNVSDFLNSNTDLLKTEIKISCKTQAPWVVDSLMIMKYMTVEDTYVIAKIYPTLPTNNTKIFIIDNGDDRSFIVYDNNEVVTDQSTISSSIAEALTLTSGIIAFTVDFKLTKSAQGWEISSGTCTPIYLDQTIR